MFSSQNQNQSRSRSVVPKNEHLNAVRLAAYFFKRLKKPHVQATDVSASVDEILKDEVQMVTCRVLGYLLLGIVRIYSKKVEYLLYDCQEVLLGIKSFALRSREALPEPETRSQRAPYFSITLPETYELDAFDVEVLDDAIDGNVLPLEEITLKESGLENAGTKQQALDMCLHEDIAGSYYPCSPMYSPFGDVLSSYGIDVNLRKLLNIDGLTTTMEIIKENRFSQRECMGMDRVVLTPVEEEHQNVDMTHNVERQDNSEKIKDPELLLSVQGIYAEVGPEMLQDSGGNDANLVRSSEVEVVLDDDNHAKPHSEDPLNEQDQIMVSEPEHLVNEMHMLDSQDACPSNLQAEMEKLRNNTCSREERVYPSLLCEPKEPQELANAFVEDNHEDGELDVSEIPTEEGNSVSTQLSTPDIKIPSASDVASTMPQLVGIATPAPKERARKSRKRKCIIDEAIVLSAEAMKRSIHDASDLVSKRRKVAHTSLAVWRAARSFPHHFFDPLFTGISPELRSLYYGKKLKMAKSFKTMALEKLDISKIASPGMSDQIGVVLESPVRSCAGISEQVVVAPETPVQWASGLVMSEQIGIAPETPVQHSTIMNLFERPMSPGTPNYESITRPSLFESPRREPSPSLDQQFDLSLEDEVTSSHPEGNSEWDGWSGRTRLVARYLRKSFLKLEERSVEETLSLSRVVKGRTKKESARLFYEILVLSSKGLVGVKQDESYGDVLVRKLEKLDRISGPYLE